MHPNAAEREVLETCIALTEAGLNKFGSYEELARQLCHGRDNVALASRLKTITHEFASDNSLTSFSTLKDQLEAALR